MSILQMSFSASVLIMVIMIIRALAINKLPKKTFLAFWAVALVRLLVPFSFPSPFSVYSLLINNTSITKNMAGTTAANFMPIIAPMQMLPENITAAPISPTAPAPSLPLWAIIWIGGVILSALYFMIAYVRCYKRFQTSVVVENEFVTSWLAEHKIVRPISIRQSGRISAPLTYGIFRPVILFPQKTDWWDIKQLTYILAHEYVHIRRFDAVTKLFLTAALCIHWFNPLVWAMYLLSNRDIELSCDEAVVRSFGEAIKSSYALILVSMEEKKSAYTPYYNSFSKNSIEERIVAIMKYRKSSVITIAIAALLVIGTTTTFALSASASEHLKVNPPDMQNNITNAGVLSNNETAPLRINSSGVQYDDSAYRWPLNAIRVTNTSDKTIVNYEIACLAYDKKGNPIELYWDALNVAANGEVGSVGFGDGVDYGYVTGISPNSPKSYRHIYIVGHSQWLTEKLQETSGKSDKLLQENIQNYIEENQLAWEKELTQILGQEKVRQMAREWAQGLLDTASGLSQGQDLQDDGMFSLSAGQDEVLGYSLFDGWEQSTGEHIAAYIIACVKQVTFDDGSVWVNPEYEKWLANYQGKTVAVNTLENFYN